MRYVSTRGDGAPISFKDAVLTGLAPDGGLYVPESYATVSLPETDDPFAIAETVLGPYASGLDLSSFLKKAWGSFDDPDIAPLVEMETGLRMLELFHGPTLAFKDIGLQFLGAAFEVLSDKQLTVLGATSGDTGAAAVQALRGKKNVRLFMLHPKGKITEVQRRQMTTADEGNIFNVAIEGTFDDCQRLLKQILGNKTLAEKFNFTTVNSINWGRILAQSVYYWWASLRLKGMGPVHFVVPSGNFGNAFSGYVAMRSGAPISGITIATNANDILARTLETGRYQPATAVETLSPAMDIQVASNFERLLFEASDRKPDLPEACAAATSEGRGYDIPGGALVAMRSFFSAEAASEQETGAAIARVYENTGKIIDPHTAVGYAVWSKRKKEIPGNTVLLATAHPAKFAEAIEVSIGRSVALPERLASLMKLPEHCHIIPAEKAALETFVEEHLS